MYCNYMNILYVYVNICICCMYFICIILQTVFEMGQSTNSIPLLQMKLLRERNMPSVINYHRKKREQHNDSESVRLKNVDLPSSDQTEIREAFNNIITQRPRVTGQKKRKNLKKTNQTHPTQDRKSVV